MDSSHNSERDAQRELITACEGQVFSFKADTDMWTPWHYHPEIDILLVLKNSGYHITGDCIGEIGPGTLILNGSNVPHAFHPNEPDEGNLEKPAMLVIQFSEQSLGAELLSKLEMARVRRFLDTTGCSFEFFGKTRARVGEIMKGMQGMSELQRLSQFILILDLLASAPEEDKRSLVSQVYAPSLNAENVQRIDQLRDWIFNNLDRKLTLDEVAKHARMSGKSFSRFFKKNTGKTFVQYVNELRIGVACRKLIETDASVSEICYASGFNNLSNFNRRFLDLKGVSPRELRAQYRRQLAY